MHVLALFLLWCGVWPQRALAEEPLAGWSALIDRASAQIAAQQDVSCEAVGASYREAYEEFRHHYHARPGQEAFGVRGMPAYRRPVTLRAADQLLLQRFIQEAAMHSARCAQHDASPAAYLTVHEWITHASLLIFRLVAPDEEQRLGLLESVLSKGGLSDTQERLIEVLRHDMVARGDVRGDLDLARVINRERARERAAREGEAARRRAHDRQTKKYYVVLILILTCLALYIVVMALRFRPSLARLSVPVGHVDVCAPYHRCDVTRMGSADVLSWSALREAWLDEGSSYGVVGVVCVVMGIGVLAALCGAPVQRAGYVYVLLGWALFMAGMVLWTQRLWIKRDEKPVKVASVEHTKRLLVHQEVLVALSALQYEHYAILARHPAWRPWRDMSGRVQGGAYQDVLPAGRAAILLWRGLWRMRWRGKAPALSCTQELCALYVESRDEWGNAFELYWDMLRGCTHGEAHVEAHVEACERAWEAQWAWLDEVDAEQETSTRLIRMLEGAMLCGRRWRASRWLALWRARHGMHRHMSGVIWLCEEGTSQELFWVDESLACVTCEMNAVQLGEEVHIGVASAAQLSARDALVWGELFADHELIVELEQLERVGPHVMWPESAHVLVFRGGAESWRETWHDVQEVEPLGYLAAFDVVVCVVEHEGELHLGVVPSREPRFASEPLCALHTLHPVLLAELRRIARLGVRSSGALTVLYAIDGRQGFALAI